MSGDDVDITGGIRAAPRGDPREFHALLLQRVYHEDGLFGQRSSQFIAGNALLVAAAAFLFDEQKQNLPLILLVSSLGALLSLLYTFAGSRHRATLDFWNKVLSEFERFHEISLDHTIKDYYAIGQSRITYGDFELLVKDQHKRPRYSRFLWKVPWFRSPSQILGVLTPALMMVFWLAFIALAASGA